MPQPQQRPILQRLLIIFSGFAFLGSTGFMAVSMLTSSKQTAQNTPQSQEDAATQQLKVQEQNFLLVLAREPDNKAALQGLIQTRIEMGNLEGALDSLKKWAELEPENLEVLQGIAGIQIQLQQYDQAIASLDKLIALNPDSPEVKKELETVKQQLEMIQKGEVPAPNPTASPSPTTSPEKPE